MASAGSISDVSASSSVSAPSSPVSSSAPASSSASSSASSASAVSVPPSPSLPSSSSSIFSSSASSTTSATPSSTTRSSSTILTTPSMTVSQFTSVGTSNGQTFTTIVEITSTIAAGSTVAANASTAPPASHTAAIVGGVIGGLAFLAIIGAAFLWFRRRSRYKSEFDGNFDPARVTGTRPISSGPEMIQNHTTGGTLPRMDIEDDEDDGMGGRLPHSTVGGGIITPFAYTPTASAYGSTRSRSPPAPSGSPPPMSQYSQDGYTPTLSSAGGYYTAVAQQAQPVGGYYPPAPPSSSGSSGNQYNPRIAKEREAGARRSGNFAVANPSHEPDSRGMSGGYDEQYQAYLRGGPQGAQRGSQSEYTDPSSHPLSPTGSSSGAAQRAGGGVLVHQDGGRVEPDTVPEEEADEIPPTYDSLPSGERK